MQSRSYPDKRYTCDGISQRTLSQYATLRDRAFYRCGAVVLLLVAGIFISNYLGVKILTLVFTGMVAAVVVLMVVFVLHIPRVRCTRCSSFMKRRYMRRSKGPSEDLFLVCDHCKTYADAHQSCE